MNQAPVGGLIGQAEPAQRLGMQGSEGAETLKNRGTATYGGLAEEWAGSNSGTERVQAQLLEQLFKQAPVGIVATLVNACILVFILWNQISHNVLIAWLGATAAVAVLRGSLVSGYRKAKFQRLRREWWGNLHIAGFGLSGILWGSTGILLFPQASTAHQAFIAFTLGGMVAGAVGTCSSVLTAFVAFSFPAVLPLLLRLLLVGDELHTAMGAMTLLFIILTFLTARHVNRTARELVTLKEHFADKVTERTTELLQANDDLNREIVERQQAEKSLRASEERIRMVIDHAQVVLWALDQNGAFTLSEGRGLAALGLEPGKLVGCSLFDAYSAFPQIIADAREALRGNSVSSVTEIKGSIFESRFVPVVDDQGVVSGATGVAIDITAREHAEAQIRSALREKDVLLKEIHHRVKNNLAVIISILKMQSSRITDPGAKAALRDCHGRVRAMALIHDTLYQAGDLAAIPLESYARDLSENLGQAMLAGEEHRRIE